MIMIRDYALDIVHNVPVTEWSLNMLDVLHMKERQLFDRMIPNGLNQFLIEVGQAYCALHPSKLLLLPSQRIPCLIMYDSDDDWNEEIARKWYDALKTAGYYIPASKDNYYTWVQRLYRVRVDAL